jgi:hypothetical protein
MGAAVCVGVDAQADKAWTRVGVRAQVADVARAVDEHGAAVRPGGVTGIRAIRGYVAAKVSGRDAALYAARIARTLPEVRRLLADEMTGPAQPVEVDLTRW